MHDAMMLLAAIVLVVDRLQAGLFKSGFNKHEIENAPP
jgi:hypothetical protein